MLTQAGSYHISHFSRPILIVPMLMVQLSWTTSVNYCFQMLFLITSENDLDTIDDGTDNLSQMVAFTNNISIISQGVYNLVWIGILWESIYLKCLISSALTTKGICPHCLQEIKRKFASFAPRSYPSSVIASLQHKATQKIYISWKGTSAGNANNSFQKTKFVPSQMLTTLRESLAEWSRTWWWTIFWKQIKLLM